MPAVAPTLEAEEDGAEPTTERPSFRLQLALVAAAGFAYRVVYAALAFRGVGPQADGVYYSWQAELNADGQWFKQPLLGGEAADHPPLNSLLLTVPATLWRGNWMAMRVTMAVAGVLTIVFVGLLARMVARRMGAREADRVGVIAAALTAVYANFWMNDAIMMAEAVTAACIGGALAAAYWFVDRPSVGRAALMGAAIGLGALARAEVAALAVLVALPAIVLAARRDDAGRDDAGRNAAGASRTEAVARTDRRGRHLPQLRRAVPQATACGAAALLVVAPWVGWNLARFERPTFLSTGEGHVVAGANCDGTYHGPALGFWSYGCAFENPDAPEGGDQSERSAWYGERGAEYRNDHLGRLPVVVAARLARAFSVGWIGDSAWVNTYEGRPSWASNLGVAQFWVLVPLAVAGAVIARRRGLLTWPLLTMVVLAVGVAAWYYGHVRLRLPAEFPLVVLAAIALAVLWDRWAPSRSGGTRASVTET